MPLRKYEIRPVPKFRGYEASASGNVYRNGCLQEYKHIDHGYHTVWIAGWGYVHRAEMVCVAFHGDKPFVMAEVRHLNGIRADDRAENLAWGTHQQNMIDAVYHGTLVAQKLRPEDIIEIREKYAAGKPYVTQQDLADDYGVSRYTIGDIITRRSWAHIT